MEHIEIEASIKMLMQKIKKDRLMFSFSANMKQKGRKKAKDSIKQEFGAMKKIKN